MKQQLLFMMVLYISTFAMLNAAQAQEDPVLPSYETEDEILNQADVRGFVWGLPKDIIRAEEKSQFVEASEEGDILYYYDTIRGIRSSINYEFEKAKLRRVRIFSEKSYTFPQHRIDDLVKMKRDLDKRFGETIDQQLIWRDEREKDFPDMWGWAVLSGDLQLIMKWQSENTLVTLYCGLPVLNKRGRKGKSPLLFVTYEDRKAKQVKDTNDNKKSIEIVPRAPLLAPQ